MADFSKIAGVNVKDAKARNDIDNLKEKIESLLTNIEDFGAVCDGVTDDTQAIKNCLNSGSIKIVFPTNKTTIISEPIEIPNTVKHIELNNCHIKYNYEQVEDSIYESCFIVKNNDNLIIEGGKIEYTGTFDLGESYAGSINGILIENSNNVICKNMEVSNFNNNGIAIETNNDSNNYSLNIVVENCYLHHNRIAGVIFGNTKNLTINNNKLEYNGLETDGGTGYGCAGLSTKNPIDTMIINNFTKGNYRNGIDFHSGTNGTIKNNIVDGDRLYGIYIESIKELGSWIIEGNIIKNIINNGGLINYNTSYGIYLGSYDSTLNDKKTSFIINNNKIVDCGKENEGKFIPIFLASHNLHKGYYQIINNYINCKDITRFLHTTNGEKTENYYNDILINNNYFECNSVGFAFSSTSPHNRIIEFINNVINIKSDYDKEQVFSRTSTTVDNNNQIYLNNVINILSVLDNFKPFLILRTQQETMKNNKFNGQNWREWNGQIFIDYLNTLPTNENLYWKLGSLVILPTKIYRCTTEGRGSSASWTELI